MTNKIIKFPETTDQAWKRMEEKHKYSMAKIDFEMKRGNWFAAGVFTGAALMSVTLCLLHFL